MQNLKDLILEKLKVTKNNSGLDISELEVIVDYLYSNDISKRQEAIDCIKEEIQISNCRRLKTTNTIKNSQLNFIQLSRIHFDDNNPNCIIICKRYGSNYITIFITTTEKPAGYFEGWNRTQPNLSPKTEELYEIPEDSILNDICSLIREKYKSTFYI